MTLVFVVALLPACITTSDSALQVTVRNRTDAAARLELKAERASDRPLLLGSVTLEAGHETTFETDHTSGVYLEASIPGHPDSLLAMPISTGRTRLDLRRGEKTDTLRLGQTR